MMYFATCLIFVVFAVYSASCFHQCTAPYSPHPTDCNKFYQCDHGHPVLKSCGPGTHWNARLQTCDWPVNAQCQSGGAYPNHPGYPNYPSQPGNYPPNGGPIPFPPNQPTPGYPGRPVNQPGPSGNYPPTGNYPQNNGPIQFPPNQPTQQYPGQQLYPGPQYPGQLY